MPLSVSRTLSRTKPCPNSINLTRHQHEQGETTLITASNLPWYPAIIQCANIHSVHSLTVMVTSIFPRQLALNIQHIALTLHLNDAIHLRRVAHQLHGASIHHARRRIAVLRQIIQHDIRHGETARRLSSHDQYPTIPNVETQKAKPTNVNG